MTTKTLKEKKEKIVPEQKPSAVRTKTDVPLLYRPLYTLPVFARLLIVLFGLSVFLSAAGVGGFIYAKHRLEAIDRTETLHRHFMTTFHSLNDRLHRVEAGRALVDEKMSPCAHLEHLTAQVNDLSETVKVLVSEVDLLQDGTIDVILSTLGTLETENEKNAAIAASLEKRLAGLEERAIKPETILTLIGRIEEIQNDLHKRFRERQHFALLSAVTLLKEAVVSGRPYELEVLAVRSLADEDPFVLQQVTILLPYAASGVFSEPALLADFDRSIVSKPDPVPSSVPSSDTILSKIGAKLSSLVSIRQKPTEQTHVQIDIVRTQFRRYIERGDFQSAALSLNMLPETYVKRLTDSGFFERLRRHTDVRSALKDLTAYTYAAIAADRLQP